MAAGLTGLLIDAPRRRQRQTEWYEGRRVVLPAVADTAAYVATEFPDPKKDNQDQDDLIFQRYATLAEELELV